MSNLYDILGRIDNILSLEIDKELKKEALDGLQIEKDEKLDNIANYIRTLENQKATIDGEIKRLNERKLALINKQKYLKEYVRDFLKLMGRKSIKTTLNTFSIRKGTQKLKLTRDLEELVKEDLIPEVYIKRSIELNKEQLLKDMKDGIEVDGIELENSDETIVIR